MRIGIDISALQGPHRMRGIGYALMNFINGIPAEERRAHSFVFYVLPHENTRFGDPLKLLDTEGMDFEVRQIAMPPRLKPGPPPARHFKVVPGRLANLPRRVINSSLRLADFYTGDPRKQNLKGIDVYLQPDQSLPLPSKIGLKKAMIIYDIIPYVLDGDYLTSYRTARERGYSFKGSVRCGISRWLYAHKIKVNSRRADLLLSISSHTKQDFVKILGVEDSKIAVTPLGVTQPGKSVKAEAPNYRYVESTWGYLKQPYELPKATPFLLFVGGADRRRSLSDLVAAFNNLRAEGHDLKLVLSGDIMQGPLNIPTPETQYALTNSSYLDDIIFMGFTEDSVRDWLYKNCLAFVYPSRYEGFGLPVLEAMVYGSPVICYENGALKEIGGEAPLYANDSETLRQKILELLSASNKQLSVMRANGEAQAAKFSWTKTAKDMLSHLSQLDG